VRKVILTVLLTFSLAFVSGCSSTQNSIESEIVLACDDFSKIKMDKGFPQEHFARLAQLDSGYIPLAAAAGLLNLGTSQFPIRSSGVAETQLIQALALLDSFCSNQYED
jgi:hypothetical protein